LKPGDHIQLRFNLKYITKGFRNGGPNTSIVQNGSFLHSSRFLPRLGYQESNELSDDDDRKDYGLSQKPRKADLEDMSAYQNNVISNDADWIDFEATISTKANQVAIAPGYLQEEWTKEGRRYFHYKMDAPILNFYAFLSADYTTYRERWPYPGPEHDSIDIAIYYHQSHDYNIERFVESIKKSISYFSDAFSPYQHRQMRILEFPRYRSFAQSFPNTVPYSEMMGFIMQVDEEENIDFPFYVTSHEVAHQWWGHQVIGADVQGGGVMMETIAQYSALMVMEKEYGKQKVAEILEYELDDYLSGRGRERKKEMPLLREEGQSYI
jgi:aminopeptidase N